MNLELLFASIVFLAMVVAWVTLPLKATNNPVRTEE